MRETRIARRALWALLLAVLGMTTTVRADDWIWSVALPTSTSALNAEAIFSEVVPAVDRDVTGASLGFGVVEFYESRDDSERLLYPSLSITSDSTPSSSADLRLRDEVFVRPSPAPASFVEAPRLTSEVDPITRVIRRLPLDDLAEYGIRLDRGVAWDISREWTARVSGEWSLQDRPLPKEAKSGEPREYGRYTVHLFVALDI